MWGEQLPFREGVRPSSRRAMRNCALTKPAQIAAHADVSNPHRPASGYRSHGPSAGALASHCGQWSGRRRSGFEISPIDRSEIERKRQARVRRGKPVAVKRLPSCGCADFWSAPIAGRARSPNVFATQATGTVL